MARRQGRPARGGCARGPVATLRPPDRASPCGAGSNGADGAQHGRWGCGGGIPRAGWRADLGRAIGARSSHGCATINEGGPGPVIGCTARPPPHAAPPLPTCCARAGAAGGLAGAAARAAPSPPPGLWQLDACARHAVRRAFRGPGPGWLRVSLTVRASRRWPTPAAAALSPAAAQLCPRCARAALSTAERLAPAATCRRRRGNFTRTVTA
jgi:hypothetical protein